MAHDSQIVRAKENLNMSQSLTLSRYKNCQHVSTDGSKEDSKVGCAVISDNHSNMQRKPDVYSIFTAEAKAVDLVIDSIKSCDTN